MRFVQFPAEARSLGCRSDGAAPLEQQRTEARGRLALTPEVWSFRPLVCGTAPGTAG